VAADLRGYEPATVVPQEIATGPARDRPGTGHIVGLEYWHGSQTLPSDLLAPLPPPRSQAPPEAGFCQHVQVRARGQSGGRNGQPGVIQLPTGSDPSDPGVIQAQAGSHPRAPRSLLDDRRARNSRTGSDKTRSGSGLGSHHAHAWGMARPAPFARPAPPTVERRADARFVDVAVPAEAPRLNPAAAQILARIIQRATAPARQDE
jgi:hypothetical protein